MYVDDEVPESARLELEPDIAAWLRLIANAYYRGDMEHAMNESLRAIMEMEQAPNDVWGPLIRQAASRHRGRRRPSPSVD